ncbi:toxin-antitoxin system YwqK family antitoxin [Brevibacillus gelatini]|uniref:Toxin-antitoxin system YwqK family antitoxin n=1 Tax=Brevibacillus gelatini TaxID=1655277 RepID=A0A3M8BF36_9BACL|nr:toxin-antitoxin system YwqK family antitoxin [Brevibacillus gelatini]RNB61505.1 toxin-antitoxin system YwqK family antitoxin [Brevibacillus gelatini]
MEDNREKYTIEEIISNGVDFEDLWYSSTSDEILDNAEDEGGKPFNGIAYELYGDGRLRYFCFYKNGFQHGLFQEFYENGEKKSEQIMRHGQTKGKKTSWYRNGKIKSLGEYENGVELSYNEWDENGNLIVSRKLSENSDNFKLLLSRRELHRKMGRE